MKKPKLWNVQKFTHSGFFVRGTVVNGIPDLLACIPEFKSQDSRFQNQWLSGFCIPRAKISLIMESGFAHMRRHSRGNKTDIKTRMLAWMLDINRLTWASFDFASFSSLTFASFAMFWYSSHSYSFRSRYCLFPCIWIAEGLHSSAIIFLARNQKAQHGCSLKECFVINIIKFCVW